MSDVVEGQIGPESKYDVDLEKGKIVVKLDYAGEQAKAGIYLEVDLMDLLRKGALKTDNKLDDKAVEMIGALL